MALTMSIEMPRRMAEVTVNAQQGRMAELQLANYPATVMCHVLGLMQCTELNKSYPVFVCELENGRCIQASPYDVRFVDTIGGVIV